MTKKKKILFHSNFCKAFTGFGKNTKNVLKYLHSTGKYEIIEAANGFPQSHKGLSTLPWTCIGTLPDNKAKLAALQRDPNLAKAASYGSETIDDIIKEYKPDIYLGAEDIWAFDKYWEKKWWNKINCMIWTTLDSEPLLPMAVDAAKHIKNYFVWANFAEREMNKLGHSHVKSLHGIVDPSNFKKQDSSELRKKYLIDSNCFIIGFVFRNQLRKSVPNLLDGFLKFKQKHPNANAKLLLHTHWDEGWDILRLMKEKNIDRLDILTTYYCNKCKKYEIKPFSGQKQDCKFCGSAESQNTTNVKDGVSEQQLNEIYSLMDVYCHPFTSGGQELPIQEAKLCELITLVTNYSCGEEQCTPESGGLPLEWTEYREPGTQFIKASTSPQSICDQLSFVYEMKPSKRSKIGKKSRKYIIDNYSPKVIGSKLEKILDDMPYHDWDFDFSEQKRNPDYNPPKIESDSLWLVDIYKNILNMDVNPESDEGHKHWMEKLNSGSSRAEILKYFKKIANEENIKIDNSFEFEDFLGDEKASERIAVVMPESAGDVLMMNSLMDNLFKIYPDKKIYFFTKPHFYDLIEDHPAIHKVLPYNKSFDLIFSLEGQGEYKGFFDVAYLPYGSTQKFPTYTHNGKDVMQINFFEEV
jgi:glycosyltransferase involved in cell wall biosynthesis